MNRRTFLRAAAATTAAFAGGRAFAAAATRPPRIVLRSSWQTVNIGDIGHTPGVLALLEKHLPEAEVLLWPMDVRNGRPGPGVRRTAAARDDGPPAKGPARVVRTTSLRTEKREPI